FQLRRPEFFKPGLKCVPDLPLHIRRDTNAARASQRCDSRGDIYSIAIDVTVTMHHVANVNADFDFDSPVGGDVVISFGQGALDFDGALRRFQRASEFDKESVADGFDFGAVKSRKNFA